MNLNIQVKEIASAIVNKIESDYGGVKPKGHAIINNIAKAIESGELILVDGEPEKNAVKLKRYGNSYDVSNGNLMYDGLAAAILKTLAPHR